MNAPVLLASFNYYPPSKTVMIAGGVLLLLCQVGIAKWVVGRLSGMLIGGVSSGLITTVVILLGRGDLRVMLAAFYGCMGLAAGAVFGMILARKEEEEAEEAENVDVPTDDGEDESGGGARG